MPRGGSKQVMEQSTGLQNKATQLATGQQQDITAQRGQNQALEQSILPGYQEMASGKLPSWQQEAIGIGEGTGREALQRRAARTRNEAGVPEAIAEMARGRESAIGEAALKQRTAGLEGQAGMYGIDQALLAKQLGLPAESLGVAVGALSPAAHVAGTPNIWEKALADATAGLIGGR